MEGNYLWEKWCKKHKYPKTYAELQKLFPDKTQEELDDLWEKINQQFFEEQRQIKD